MDYTVSAVAHVLGGRDEQVEDNWGRERAVIRLAPELPTDVLLGLENYSHLEVIFLFDRIDPAKINLAARHPRADPKFPVSGIFAMRGPNRPNRLGVSVCQLVQVDGRDLHVAGLDALAGTPVLD